MENLARKLTFGPNIEDILVRLTAQNDLVQLKHRIATAPKQGYASSVDSKGISPKM